MKKILPLFVVCLNVSFVMLLLIDRALPPISSSSVLQSINQIGGSYLVRFISSDEERAIILEQRPALSSNYSVNHTRIFKVPLLLNDGKKNHKTPFVNQFHGSIGLGIICFILSLLFYNNVAHPRLLNEDEPIRSEMAERMKFVLFYLSGIGTVFLIAIVFFK